MAESTGLGVEIDGTLHRVWSNQSGICGGVLVLALLWCSKYVPTAPYVGVKYALPILGFEHGQGINFELYQYRDHDKYV